MNNLLYEDGKVLPPLDLRLLSGTTALWEFFMVDLNLIVEFSVVVEVPVLAQQYREPKVWW